MKKKTIEYYEATVTFLVRKDSITKKDIRQDIEDHILSVSAEIDDLKIELK